MSQLITLNEPFQGISTIKIFAPQRGVGGTAAFPVIVDDIKTMFEMDDECNWASAIQHRKLNREVISFITHHLENIVA